MSCSSIPPLPSHLQSQIDQSISTGGSWGAVITPAAPEFSPNFPDVIGIPVEFDDLVPVTGDYINENWDYRYGGCTGYVHFYITPSNLNYAPVYDCERGAVTNGIERNEAFFIEIPSSVVIPNTGPFGPINGVTFPDSEIMVLNAKCDPHTGLVTGELRCNIVDGLDDHDYMVPITLKIKNGNGEAIKTVNLKLIDKP